MTLPDDPDDTAADRVLGNHPDNRADDVLREAVLTSTLAVLRRRRIARRLLWPSALVACYLAGMLTLAIFRSGLATSPRPTPMADGPRQASPGVNPPPGKAVFAATQRLEAEPVKTRFEVLRDTGDRFVENGKDLRLAVRAYARALEVASAEQRAISPERDNWLLMALKSQQRTGVQQP